MNEKFFGNGVSALDLVAISVLGFLKENVTPEFKIRVCQSCAWLSDEAECRRLPPAPDPQGIARWPKVRPDQSCGLWDLGNFSAWVNDVSLSATANSEFTPVAPISTTVKQATAAIANFGAEATSALGSAGRSLIGRATEFGRSSTQRASDRIGATWKSGREYAASAIDHLAQWTNAALGTDVALTLDRWMRHEFGRGLPTAYDKAMDAYYSATHIGGGFHRLFDGGHDLIGAWEAAGRAAAANGDIFSERVAGYLAAIWKDVVTPQGLPVNTIDYDWYSGINDTLREKLHVPAGWVADMASFTATETIGAGIAVAAAAFRWNESEIEKFSSLVGSFGVSTIVSANPLLGIVTIVCTAASVHKVWLENGEVSDLSFGVAKGAAGTGAYMVGYGALIALGGPATVSILAGVVAGILAHKASEMGRAAVSEVSWADVAEDVSQKLKGFAAKAQSAAPSFKGPWGTAI